MTHEDISMTTIIDAIQRERAFLALSGMESIKTVSSSRCQDHLHVTVQGFLCFSSSSSTSRNTFEQSEVKSARAFASDSGTPVLLPSSIPGDGNWDDVPSVGQILLRPPRENCRENALPSSHTPFSPSAVFGSTAPPAHPHLMRCS